MDEIDLNDELIAAARYGEEEEVSELLKNGANVNHQDATGSTGARDRGFYYLSMCKTLHMSLTTLVSLFIPFLIHTGFKTCKIS